jgi:hypothetical protein
VGSTIFIPSRFSGPPNSGNGGYTCGLLARILGGPSEVTLRKPIPIEQNLEVVIHHGTGSTESPQNAQLNDGSELIAEAVRFEMELGEVPTVSFGEAEIAAAESPAFKNHPFPTCFVCGPQRVEGDGLRIFPGSVETTDDTFSNLFAAPWRPDDSCANENGIVGDEIVWAALDCPTGFAGGFPYEGKLVTGRLGAKLLSPVRAGEKCVLVSWRLAVEGRKHHAAAILVGEAGEVHAQARATWIKLG